MLLACGHQPLPATWGALLEARGWRPCPLPPGAAAAGARASWRLGPRLLLLGPGCFLAWAGWAEVGLASAGTATEQLAGLGIPALSAPGPGPQFKASFARRQSRLLGGAVQPCASATELATKLGQLLADGAWRRQLGRIGQRRMGSPGGSDRLAALLLAQLLG